MVLITGATGFVGQNLTNYLNKNQIKVEFVKRDDLSSIGLKLKNHVGDLIHLSGKAHDLKNTSNPSEYYEINTQLTKKVFDEFLVSEAKVFITLSSVKAVADSVDDILSEDYKPNPLTHYGKSKLLAEQYILTKKIPAGKRVYVLRPCMIHGPGNKGNLSLLFKLVENGFPWPLGNFENKRSLCSIDNICFVIKELIMREDIPSGVYNIADDEPLSTNEIIGLISKTVDRKIKILKVPKIFIIFIARMGDFLKLPLNSERLQKLTQSYVVSNHKIIKSLGKPLPFSSKNGLEKTFNSFIK